MPCVAREMNRDLALNGASSLYNSISCRLGIHAQRSGSRIDTNSMAVPLLKSRWMNASSTAISERPVSGSGPTMWMSCSQAGCRCSSFTETKNRFHSSVESPMTTACYVSVSRIVLAWCLLHLHCRCWCDYWLHRCSKKSGGSCL